MPPGMHVYIVTLNDETRTSGMGRRALFDRGIARGTDFRRQLEERLANSGMAQPVAAIGQPSPFPIVTVTCTPDVAAFIDRMPEVESIVRDRNDLQLLT